MSVGILGINSPSLVQGFDKNNSQVSKLKKLQSRFFSSQSSWQSTKYEVPVDPIIFNMCNDYKKKLDMGSKLSQISCGVPSIHYEIKKPAVNIIGGYVGAKSQQNRENQNHFAIHEILANLLPDILSENPQSPEDYPEFQPERVFGKRVDFKLETEICFQSFTLQMEEKVNQPVLLKSKINSSSTCPSKGTVKDDSGSCFSGSVPNMLQNTLNSKSKSPTYASVVSAPVLSSKLHQPTTNNNDNSRPTMNKSLKGRKNRKCRRKKKRKTNKAHEVASSAEGSANLVPVLDDQHFPSLCEEATLQEPLGSDFVQGVSNTLITRMDDFINKCADLGSENSCSYDEVDSPHSTNYSCSPQENMGRAASSTFVCQNNSIAFILNGNDELSDTDSDWSCENKDSFHDEAWDTFREDFECFQNFFVFENFSPDRMNSSEDSDCELQDEEFCVYINRLENESDLHADDVLAARLKEINRRWDSAMNDVVLDGKRTKVHFAPDNFLVEIRCFESSLEEISSESWEHYQLDRCHFRNRVKALEPIIAPCLDRIHRQKVWDRLSCKTRRSEASTQEE